MFCFSCSRTKTEPIPKNDTLEKTEQIAEKKHTLFTENAEPFYPVKETVEDIQAQVNELRSRIIDYEERKTESLQKMKSGYPRFVYHPLINLINAK